MLAVSSSLGIWLYDAKGDFQAPLQFLDQDDWVHGVAFSPDGRILAGAGNQSIQLWDVHKASKIKTFPGKTLVAFSPDGRLLATRGLTSTAPGAWPTATVELYDVATGRLVSTLEGDHWSIRMTDIAFSPDGQLIAAIWSATDYGTGCDQDVVQRLQVWQVKDALQQAYLEPEAMLYAVEVNSFAFSPDSRVLVHQNVGGGVAVWDTAAHRVTKVWGSDSAFDSGAFSPDGKLLAVAESIWEGDHPANYIALYDTETGNKLKTFSDDLWTPMVFAKDNRTLAGLSGNSLRLIDVLTSDARDIPLGQSWTLSQNGAVAVQPMPSEIRVFDFSTGKSQAIPEGEDTQKLLLSDDGALLAVVDGQGEVRIWDTASGKAKATLTGRLSSNDVYFFDTGFNGDSTILATPFSAGDSNGQLMLWSTATGEQIGAVPGIDYSQILFSPRGSMAAVYRGDTRDIALWRVGANASAKLVTIAPARPIAFNPEGTGIVYEDGRYVYFYDIVTGHKSHLVTLQEANFTSVYGVFSPNGKQLALVEADYNGCGPGTSYQFYMVDMVTRLLQPQWADVEVWEISRDNLVFNPLGTLFASTSDDAIHVWDEKTGEELVTLQNNTGYIQRIAFSADGTSLLSQNDDGTIRRWQVR